MVTMRRCRLDGLTLPGSRPMRRFGSLACCVGLQLFHPGCAAIVDFPDDPVLVEPESAELALAEPNWRCLDEAPSPTVAAASRARVRIQACDALRGCSLPIPGVTARVCAKLDVDCTNPLSTGIADAAGLFEFDVPTDETGFDGFLEVVAPSEPCMIVESSARTSALSCDLLPQCDPENPDARCEVPTHARALWFFNPPIVADWLEPAALSLIPTVALPSILRAAGADFDPMSGIFVLTAMDCDHAPAAGVTYEMPNGSGRSLRLYMEGGVLSGARSATDASGVGGFVGVPPGFADVAAYTPDGALIGGIGVLSAPFTVTYSGLVPTPAAP
jgi:hypothetical protein